MSNRHGCEPGRWSKKRTLRLERRQAKRELDEWMDADDPEAATPAAEVRPTNEGRAS